MALRKPRSGNPANKTTKGKNPTTNLEVMTILAIRSEAEKAAALDELLMYVGTEIGAEMSLLTALALIASGGLDG